MDQNNVKPVTDWPEPATIKELQWFLGFANFYRRFIRNYSTVAGPLTSLLKGKPKKLSWSEPALEAFMRLKHSFTTVPVLHHPDPETPFVVELDTSSSGIGPCCHSVRVTPVSFTLAPSSQGNSHWLKLTTMWGIMNFSPSRQHWRSGATGSLSVSHSHRPPESGIPLWCQAPKSPPG